MSYALSELLDEHSAAVGAALLERLRLKVGDLLRIGGVDFRVAAAVSAEPDRLRLSLALTQHVYLTRAGLERTGLVQPGARIRYRALIRLPQGSAPEAVRSFEQRLRERVPDAEYLRIESYLDAQPELRRGLERVDRFLGLAALLSLLIGGIGVAHSARAWLATRLDAIAVHKCLGLRPRELLALYLGQTAVLALLGSLAGAAAGLALAACVPRLFREVLPPDLIRVWQPLALLRGLALGLGVALVFSLEPLQAALRVPALRVLRRDAEPLPRPRWSRAATWLLLAAGIFATAWLQSRSPLYAACFSGGLALLVLLLALAARALVRAVARAPREKLPFLLRQGLAALARPGADTLGAIVALGVGVWVVLCMQLVQRRLADELATALPEDAPSLFLVDIQGDQWEGVRALLESRGARSIQSVPVVTARLSAIDGRSVTEIARERAGGERAGERSGELAGSQRPDDQNNRRAQWKLTREQRLTWMDKLPPDNRIVDGALWSDPAAHELSVERDFARDLGVGLGSRLTFDVQGRPIDLSVTSLRTVEWKSFSINFFLVAEPGALEGAPAAYIGAARLPEPSEQDLQDQLAADFPNVALIRVREILGKVLKILENVALGVRILGAFTALSGLVILAGSIAASSARRGREVALLKTLGLTRVELAGANAVEHALVGLVAGAIGAAGAGVLAWAVLTYLIEVRWSFEPGAYALAVVGSALLSAVTGVAASASALARSPMDVLRE